MLDVVPVSQFKRDLRLCEKRGYRLDLLRAVIDTLRVPAALPPKNRDHALSGNYSGFRECHIQPDWLLIYFVADNKLYLARCGTHSDLFG